MNEKKTKKIIFVCTGNTCRSPMAEAVLRSEIRRLRLECVEVLSAGTAAAKNGEINPHSAITLAENGLTLENFRSRELTDELIDEAYAVVCMTEKQRLAIEEKRAFAFFMSAGAKSGAEDKIHSFYTLAGCEIPDPFGRDLDCYRLTFQKIVEAMPKIIQKLGLATVEKSTGEEKPTPKKRGRPRKNPASVTPTTPKKRGRPKKTVEKS